MTLTEDEYETLWKDILTEMYQEAEPPLDFEEVLASPEDQPEDWFKQHYLPEEKSEEIFDKHVEGVELTDREHTGLVMTCILDLGPTNVPLEEQ